MIFFIAINAVNLIKGKKPQQELNLQKTLKVDLIYVYIHYLCKNRRVR